MEEKEEVTGFGESDSVWPSHRLIMIPSFPSVSPQAGEKRKKKKGRKKEERGGQNRNRHRRTTVRMNAANASRSALVMFSPIF